MVWQKAGGILSQLCHARMRSTFLVQVEYRLQVTRSIPCRRTVARAQSPRMGWSSSNAREIWIVAVEDPCSWSIHSPGSCGPSSLHALEGATRNWLGFAAWQLELARWGMGCNVCAYRKAKRTGQMTIARANWIAYTFYLLHTYLRFSDGVKELLNSNYDLTHMILGCKPRDVKFSCCLQDMYLVYKHSLFCGNTFMFNSVTKRNLTCLFFLLWRVRKFLVTGKNKTISAQAWTGI